jgi:hypothetical protein
LARLNNRAAGYVPALSADLQVHKFILSLIDGITPLEQIARRVAECFPERFSEWEEALAIVSEVSS